MGNRPPVDTNSNIGDIPLASHFGGMISEAFNSTAFENLIKSKGINTAIHMRHAYRAPEDHVDMENAYDENSQTGYIYYKPQLVSLIPTRISLEDRLMITNMGESGSMVATISSQYERSPNNRAPSGGGGARPNSGEDVYVRENDLIIMPFIYRIEKERVELSESRDPDLRGKRVLRTKHKAHGVDIIFDNTNRAYAEGEDFAVINNQIVFSDCADLDSTMFSVCYWARIIYKVSGALHSIRVLPSNSKGSGAFTRTNEYGPQQYQLAPSHISEYLYNFDIDQLTKCLMEG